MTVDVEYSASDGLDLEVSSASGGSASDLLFGSSSPGDSPLLVPASVARPLVDDGSVSVSSSGDVSALPLVGVWLPLKTSVVELLVSAVLELSHDIVGSVS